MAEDRSKGDVQVVPVVEEQATVERRRVETGRVRVHLRTEEHQETIPGDVTEAVEITRVPVGRVVEGPVRIREEGDVTIIPVVREEVVVTRRLVLDEEVHVRRVRREAPARESVTLRKQRVEIEREDVPPTRDEPER